MKYEYRIEMLYMRPLSSPPPLPVIARWSKISCWKRLYNFQVSSHDKTLNIAVKSETK
jgi:hypothetical protein